MECVSVLRGDCGHHHAGLGVIGVDVEDGGVDNTGHVRAVRRGAGVAGIGRESDLEK